MNLATNPDHFVLISTEKCTGNHQFTGGAPFLLVFAHYGEEKGLTSTLNEGFTVQVAVKLADGIIGGVRHQIKKSMMVFVLEP